MAVVFGLLAAILWGVGDYLARTSARALGPWRSTFYGQMPGLALFTLWLTFSPAMRHQAFSASGFYWLLAVIAGTGNTFSGYALTRGLIAGAISLVIPLAASYGAVSTVLAVLTGERLSALAAIGIALTVIGIAAAAAGRRRHRRSDTAHVPAGVGWALLAAVGYGATLWLQGHLVMPHLGPAAPLWIAAFANLCVTLSLARLRHHSLAPPPRAVLPITLGFGMLSALAFLSLALGLGTGQLAIVAVLSSLCSTITAILGVILLRERLAAVQWGGIALILAGVVLINLH